MFLARIALAAGLIALSGLTACNTENTNANLKKASEVIKTVQETTVSACNFLPTAETVGRVIGVFTGVGAQIDTAAGVAKKICASIKVPSNRVGEGGVPVINPDETVGEVEGVPVKGIFKGPPKPVAN